MTNPYRTHHSAQLTKDNVGDTITLSGWIHRKRDHGGLLFIDLRDTNGLTQCVIDTDHAQFAQVEQWRVESVITVTGKVIARSDETVNTNLPTGAIEVGIETATLQSAAKTLPFQVAVDDNAGEDLRLQYRFLDLRRAEMHNKIRLRNNVISSIRRRMVEKDFQEFQTPILTASSPEGARDYLVPSRLHPGKFYALPQAPQQFKQLLMVSGFDKYFQIAPCFRDEDGRADRLAEFYQLDVEMSFISQDDVFATMQPVIEGIFEEFNDFTGTPHKIQWMPHITYADSMLKYGSDKPDLRNPLEIVDVTSVFSRDDVEFKAFKSIIEKGGVVRAIKAPSVADQPRSFYDKLNSWAQSEGAFGMGYTKYQVMANESDINRDQYLDNFGGPIAKFMSGQALFDLVTKMNMQDGDAVFFVCEKIAAAEKFAGKARDAICDALPDGHTHARETGVFKFAWIIDYPMYERDEDTGVIDFSHNPFSMPQGGADALNTDTPENILAYQYDCICNGFELCSGAIRNHREDIMEQAFGIAGYEKSVLEDKFSGMLNAFQYGAPPHGGCAFGIDRIIMLLADEPNLREVYAFVMNGQYQDLMMNAPSAVDDAQLKDLHVKTNLPKEFIKKDEAA
jgi:aspartyl-tRNA synthetase